ncbi:MAG: DUF1501 domain-containing protein [Verrucomicrobia bacterium]|nr:DUF1501 domain-containing protein [Verrucomicrobiota bacterium]
MNLLTRRGFLDQTFRLALASAVGAAWHVPLFLRRALAQGELPSGARKLLFIFLRGGNDGLNTLVPWGDDAYNVQNRPSLYLPPPDPRSTAPGRMPPEPDLTRSIDLGNGFAGLHPALKNLGPLYNDGHLALIHRVGYPRQSRSHFDSHRYWENGTPRADFTSSGIFYRALVETGLHLGRQFPAVSVQSRHPLLLRGPLAFPNLSDPARYDLLGVTNNGADRAKILSALTQAHQVPHPERDNRPLLFGTGDGLSTSIEALRAIGLTDNNFFDTDGTTHLFPIDTASNQKGFSSGAFGFFRNLKVAAQVLAQTDAVVAGTQLDGFDTHDSQGTLTGTHARLLSWLGWGFYAVRQYLRSVAPRLWEDTVLVTLSEFGRTSIENGSLGTDHAEASVMLVAGGRVRGGVYQCDGNSWPVGPAGAQFSVKGRYLGRTVDYRSVLGEVIRKHLGATPAALNRVLPGYAEEAVEHLARGGVAPDGVPIVGELGIL